MGEARAERIAGLHRGGGLDAAGRDPAAAARLFGLVFLASSASLGVFKVAQFSQPEVYYSEPVDDSGGPSERETPF